MSTDVITLPERGALTPEIMEKVLLGGDLSKLTPSERVNYYRATCESLGLNPLTHPFDYLQLNGKLTLYARRECTEQLRSLRKISIAIVSREVVEGVYVVVSRAITPDGRTDESIGAVPIDTLKGEARANGIMKAETKSKRRVTLSIAGLAALDDSEVDSIRGAARMTVDYETGEIHEPGSQAAADTVAQRTIAELEKGRDYREIKRDADALSPDLSEKLQQSNEAVKPGNGQKKPFTIGASCEEFAKLKALGLENLGPAWTSEYYRILSLYNVRHANELKSSKPARECYRTLAAAYDSLLKLKQSDRDDGSDMPSSSTWSEEVEAGR